MTAPDLEIRVLAAGDEALLDRVAPDVFDHALAPALAAEFLADPRHHLVVAIVEDTVVGFASAVHYVHPDKPAELFINEVGVAPSHQRRGIARRILDALLAEGRAVGCREAWVLTSPDNRAARALYQSAGGHEASEPSILVAFPLEPIG